MDEKRKKIIQIGTIICILIVFLLTIFAIVKSKERKGKKLDSLPEVELYNIFEIDDISKLSDFKVEKSSNIKVASKYNVGSNSYIGESDVELNDRTGKMIFLREQSNKVNIFQTKYGIDEVDNIDTQISGYIEKFKSDCLKYIGTIDEEKTSEILFNKDDEDDKIPLGESIFNYGKLYSISYTLEKSENNMDEDINKILNNRKYEMNFYKQGSDLMCEFVKIF